MKRSLAQQRALGYLERKGTQADWAAVQLDVAKTFARLESLIEAIDETMVRQAPLGGGWSIYQVVDHLVESHRPAVEQVQRALAGEDPGAAIPAGLLSARPYVRQWRALVDALKNVHHGFLAALTAGIDGQMGGRIPVVMVVREAVEDEDAAPGGEVREWIEPLDPKAFAIALKAHSLEHVAQIQRILASMA